MDKTIKIGDRVIDPTINIVGKVIRLYDTFVFGETATILTDDGDEYIAPVSCCSKTLFGNGGKK